MLKSKDWANNLKKLFGLKRRMVTFALNVKNYGFSCKKLVFFMLNLSQMALSLKVNVTDTIEKSR